MNMNKITKSIGDDKEFRRLLENWHSQNKFVVAHESYKSLVAYIDSRPRSEDNRAEVLEEALKRIKFCCAVPAAQTMRRIAEHALASTTPQKADNE